MQKTLDLPETFIKVLPEPSPQHLRVLEQFAQFLHQQDQQGQPITIRHLPRPPLLNRATLTH